MPHESASVQPQSESHDRPEPASRSSQEKAEAQQPSPSVHPIEPEDAYLTGTSRSLQRRVLGLNVEDGQAHEHPDTPAGQHATGSFADDKESRRKHG